MESGEEKGGKKKDLMQTQLLRGARSCPNEKAACEKYLVIIYTCSGVGVSWEVRSKIYREFFSRALSAERWYVFKLLLAR